MACRGEAAAPNRAFGIQSVSSQRSSDRTMNPVAPRTSRSMPRRLFLLLVAALSFALSPVAPVGAASTTIAESALIVYDAPATTSNADHGRSGLSDTPWPPGSQEGSASVPTAPRGTSTTPSGAVVATEAERLAGRVDDFHGALDPIAQNSRTTSVMSTREGVDIISSGGRDLSPAQRALAQDGDVLGRMPGAHAEVTSLDAATKAGLSPSQIAVSRPICAGCQIAIQNSGGQILPGGMGAVWPR